MQRPRAAGGSGGTSYGYQWWTYRFPGPRGEIEVHTALGYADQFIFVIPELDMLIVSTADSGDLSGEDMRHAVRDVVIAGVEADFELFFRDCTHATLDFHSTIGGVQGAIELQRLTPNHSCEQR